MTIEVRLDGAAPGMTREQIDHHLEESAGGFTQEQLREAFRSVQDAQHWKNPIDAIVSRDQVEVLTRAIPWFTGTEADFEDVEDPDKVRVTAPGYFAGPCN